MHIYVYKTTRACVRCQRICL